MTSKKIKDKKQNNYFLVAISILWFMSITYVASQTQYYDIIADKLADPNGISTQPESILSIAIVLVSFLPSGLILASLYLKQPPGRNNIIRLLALSFMLSTAMYIIFGWYNFIVNFSN